jgi:hypothetical protein
MIWYALLILKAMKLDETLRIVLQLLFIALHVCFAHITIAYPSGSSKPIGATTFKASGVKEMLKSMVSQNECERALSSFHLSLFTDPVHADTICS